MKKPNPTDYGDRIVSHKRLKQIKRYTKARLCAEKEIRQGRSKHKYAPFGTYVWVISYRQHTPSKIKSDPNCKQEKSTGTYLLPKPSWRVVAIKEHYVAISDLFNDNGKVPGLWSY